MTTEELFVAATKRWYDYVTLDHHKDRDCHWIIGQDFAYGQPARGWYLEHNGYVMSGTKHLLFATREEAMKFAIAKIDRFMKKYPPEKP